MNSFDKAFLVLETVILQNGTPVTPTIASQRTGIHIVTCTRILAMLAEKGYLTQQSSRQGYIAGPMSVALTTRPNPYTQLANAARDPIRALAQMIHAQINLSVICGKERVMIVCEYPPSYGFWQQFRFPCEYGEAATDRLLSACRKDAACPERAKILKEKRLDYVEESTSLIIMGNLVMAKDFPPAAFGYGFHSSLGVEKVREASNRTARQIEQNLNPKSRIF